MIGNKKVIGVCIAKVQSIAGTEYLSRLHRYAKQQGYKIIIFNSLADFYNNDSNDIGCKSVYKLINYDIIDVIVIHTDEFRSKDVLNELITDISSHNMPIVLLKANDDRCYCITNDYEKSYIKLIDHVIREHGVTDTFYIAGNRENDEQSPIRINCYRKALEDNGLEFDPERVEYGAYWDIPTYQAIERIMEKREKPPRAIFCANDYMAIAVCDSMKKMGYKVPDDVIVTGFDGVPEAEYTIPQLSTCKEDYDAMAKNTIRVINRIFGGEEVPHETVTHFINCMSESCGCSYKGSDARSAAQQLYSKVHDSYSHDDFVFGWLNITLEAKELTSLMANIPTLTLTLGYVCLNNDFVSRVTENMDERKDFPFTDTLDIVLSSYSPDTPEKLNFKREELIPSLEKWAEDEKDTVCIISSISCEEEVYGYYAVRTENIELDAQRINRSLIALNLSINSIVAYYRQRIMLLGLKNAALTDQLTRLPNLKGTTEWFEEFSADPENHNKCLTFSVYGLPKYKYIYENYGIREIEESICFVADALKSSNLPDAFIGHVSDDEFLVINVYNSPDEISGVINDATSKFFNTLLKFNADLEKPYYLEVNAGCAELFPGWNGTLASFSKLAGNAMYLNRLNNNTEPKVNKSKLPAEVYKSFDLLIEKNLCDYHFQPIIDAKTGDIVAYEALMRPDTSLGLNPAEVIQTADEYDRLYDVEKFTMFNVLKIISQNHEKFRERNVFINSIPGQFLHGNDYDTFLSRYEKYLDHIVIEITEGSTVSDNELKLIRGINNGGVPIAIDDYGTGHSNIVNLLRYSPQIIKIDRFLISHIQEDTNKQLFFRSTVEFAAMNGIKILAEGVETEQELECVIKLGADYIQGYYTGHPAPEPLDEIDPKIKEFIQNRKTPR